MAGEVFDARAETDAANAEFPPFPFLAMDGTRHEMPNPQMLNPGDLMIALGLDDLDGLEDVAPLEVLEAIAPGAWAAVRVMPVKVQMGLMDAWSKACGMEDDVEGKEPSPSSATNRAARRSKQTSQSAASTSGRPRSGK